MKNGIMNKYVSLRYESKVHLYPDDSMLEYSVENLNYKLYLNRTAAQILSLLISGSSIKQAIAGFKKMYGAPINMTSRAVLDLTDSGLKAGYLQLSDLPRNSRCRITGSLDYYLPQKISLEVTSACNLSCRHCYGNFGEGKTQFIRFGQLKSLLSQLFDNGLKVITVTGGEPFLYYRITELLEWLLQRAEAIAIITNGTVLKSSAVEILSRHADKIFLQTCINGRKDYHERFTGVEGSFEKTINFARLIASLGIRLRVGMNVNEENLRDIPYVAGIANDIGAFMFSTNVSHNIGRETERRLSSEYFKGRNMNDNLTLLQGMLDSLLIVKQNYPHLLKKRGEYESLTEIEKNSQPADPEMEQSCGAGTKCVHVSANGDVNLCQISETCNFPPLGNLLRQPIQEIMSSEYAARVAGLTAPFEKSCKGCSQFVFCGGCMVRGYSQYMKDKDHCLWGRTHVAGKVSQTYSH